MIKFQPWHYIWTSLRMCIERISGVFFIHLYPTASVFGSAQPDCDQSIYDESYAVGKVIAECGWGLITGGGPGVMAYANKGCIENGGQSFGCNIVSPTNKISITIPRKVILALTSQTAKNC